mmetsp:Transcript_6659/g.13153  ORF Transcript_6659/g.13153 Transcript_6659/m.13153 type:complete len:280 (-) Transcript_6659:337-1176(-)
MRLAKRTHPSLPIARILLKHSFSSERGITGNRVRTSLSSRGLRMKLSSFNAFKRSNRLSKAGQGRPPWFLDPMVPISSFSRVKGSDRKTHVPALSVMCTLRSNSFNSVRLIRRSARDFHTSVFRLSLCPRISFSSPTGRKGKKALAYSSISLHDMTSTSFSPSSFSRRFPKEVHPTSFTLSFPFIVTVRRDTGRFCSATRLLSVNCLTSLCARYPEGRERSRSKSPSISTSLHDGGRAAKRSLRPFMSERSGDSEMFNLVRPSMPSTFSLKTPQAKGPI